VATAEPSAALTVRFILPIPLLYCEPSSDVAIAILPVISQPGPFGETSQAIRYKEPS